MATTNSNAAQRQSKSVEFEQGHLGDCYSGTMAQLVDTGKFKPEWFPGMPGNRQTSTTIEGPEFDGRTIHQLHIWRKDRSRKRFKVLAVVDEHEQNMRLFLRDKQAAHERSMERATAWLRSMVKSKAEFVATNTYTIKNQFGWMIDRMKTNAGYALSNDAIENLHATMDAMAESLKSFEVTYSPEAHESRRREIAVDAFENQGLGKLLDKYSTLGIDREAEKAKFIAEVLAIPVDGYYSAAIEEYL